MNLVDTFTEYVKAGKYSPRVKFLYICLWKSDNAVWDYPIFFFGKWLNIMLRPCTQWFWVIWWSYQIYRYCVTKIWVCTTFSSFQKLIGHSHFCIVRCHLHNVISFYTFFCNLTMWRGDNLHLGDTQLHHTMSASLNMPSPQTLRCAAMSAAILNDDKNITKGCWCWHFNCHV